MTAHIIFIIILTATIQSMFGVGVLLFGTPLLLLFGHEFVDVLFLLLPISLTINLLQISQHRRQIDFAFYRKILLLTLPPIALFLFVVTHWRINISVVVGLFLLLIALKEFSPLIARTINRMMHYEAIYFVLIGVVHGLSNLGGSLLTALVHHKNYEKNIARVTIAATYGTFAVVQLVTLSLLSAQTIHISVYDNLIYLGIGAIVFLLTDATFYAQMDSGKYRQIFAVFLICSGLTLILKTIL